VKKEIYIKYGLKHTADPPDIQVVTDGWEGEVRDLTGHGKTWRVFMVEDPVSEGKAFVTPREWKWLWNVSSNVFCLR
jgi:hypothetical protein